MKFAIDCHVAKAVQRLLPQLGHEIVVEAQRSESDATRFQRGLDAGAVAFVSGDRDIGDLIRLSLRKDIHWVRLRGARRGSPGSSEHQVQAVEQWLSRGVGEECNLLVWTPPGPESRAAIEEATRRRESRR